MQHKPSRWDFPVSLGRICCKNSSSISEKEGPPINIPSSLSMLCVHVIKKHCSLWNQYISDFNHICPLTKIKRGNWPMHVTMDIWAHFLSLHLITPVFYSGHGPFALWSCKPELKKNVMSMPLVLPLHITSHVQNK